MNVVLYTNDFEPITVIDLPSDVIEHLEKTGVVRLALQEPVKWATGELSDTHTKIVVITANKLRWRDGSVKTVLLTSDEELALRLRPNWLAGQRETINMYKQTVRTLTDRLVAAMRNNNGK